MTDPESTRPTRIDARWYGRGIPTKRPEPEAPGTCRILSPGGRSPARPQARRAAELDAEITLQGEQQHPQLAVNPALRAADKAHRPRLAAMKGHIMRRILTISLLILAAATTTAAACTFQTLCASGTCVTCWVCCYPGGNCVVSCP